MKKLLLTLAILGLAHFGTLAQTVNLNCESGEMKEEMANCWDFKGLEFSNEAITGKVGIQTGRTTGDKLDIYIKSPWIKLSNGNITLKAKLMNEEYKTLVFLYVPLIKESEGDPTIFAEYNWEKGSTEVTDISVAVPSDLLKDGKEYKIIITVVGYKGDEGVLIDDISIPGMYFSDPSEECSPLSLSESAKKDDDKDGVSNIEDAYPQDETKSYNNYFPASGSFGTLMFEDLWPAKGDYDFNDLVLGYKFNIVTNTKNEVIEIRYSIKVRAIGASFHNGFGFQLDNVPADMVMYVEGGDFKGDWTKINENGTEDGQKIANFMVFEDAFRILPSPGGSGVNVTSGYAFVEPKTIEMVVHFTNEKGESKNLLTLEELNAQNFNPYIIVNQNRDLEVHLADYKPTDRANSKFFGSGQDNSIPEKGIYYKSINNLPWALNITTEIPYSRDKEDFLNSFPAFGKWVESNGESAKDWYEDKDGNINPKYIYLTK
jgi:LruC domain-containing protein